MGTKVLLFNIIITLCPKTEVWIFQNEFGLCSCEHMIRPVFYVLSKSLGLLILTAKGKTVLCCKKKKKLLKDFQHCTMLFYTNSNWAIA